MNSLLSKRAARRGLVRYRSTCIKSLLGAVSGVLAIGWALPAYSQQAGVIADPYAEDVINIVVTDPDIYELRHEDLLAGGVDLRWTPVEQIALLNQGLPVDIAVSGSDENPLVFGEGGKIRFVGDSRETLYSRENIYTLRLDRVAASRIKQDSRAVPPGPAASSYTATSRYGPQKAYALGSPDATDPWYADRMLAYNQPSALSINLELDHYVAADDSGPNQSRLLVNLWGGSDLAGEDNDHHVAVSLNGASIADTYFDGVSVETIETFPAGLLAGSNQIGIALPLDTGYPLDLVNVDTVSIQYPRAFQSDGEGLRFQSNQSKFRIDGLNSDDVVVYRVDDAGVHAMLETTSSGDCAGQSGCAVLFAGSGGEADYHISTASGLRRPALRLLPEPAGISSGQAEYLVIAHPDFIDTGNGLLQGLVSELNSEFNGADLIDVEQIYAQYGHHQFGAEAIHEYIKAAAQPADTGVNGSGRGTKYVLLVGGDVYDYHRYLSEQSESFIPSLYQRTDSTVSFSPVDSKYGDIDDDNIPDLVVGRLPVRTETELAAILQKRSAYKNRDYGGAALFAADGYDAIQGYDFDVDAERIIEDYFSAGWHNSTAYVDELGVASARNTVINQINAGVTLTAFFGHSSTNQWSFAGLFNGSDAAGLSNVDKPTVVTQWGCWNTYYVSPDEDSMGHRFMLEGNKGAVAVMGASTLTSANAERELAAMILSRLSEGERLGDAILNAKQEYAQAKPNQLDVILGWTLLGTPDLRVQ